MKLLILTCNTGQGHNSTAGSISEKFTNSGYECTATDSLAFLSKKMSQFISSWHTRIYRHVPALFDQGYEYAEKHPSVFADESMAYNFFGHGVNKLNRYIEEGGYNSILCVHPFSAIMLTETLRRYPKNIKTGFVATDYTCSPSVADSRMDLYFIPHASLRGEFISCGVPEEKLVASGIPVKKIFFEHGNKAAAKKALGIDADAPHILMMCGSMGCGPIEELALQLSNILPREAILTVVCGTNERLKKKLEKAEKGNMRVLGYTDKIPQLMDSADLYLTKPGGLSVTEAAAKRLPMFFVDAVSGCEAYNKSFFISRGMAAAPDSSDRLAQECVSLLLDRKRLTAQSQAMEKEFSVNPADCIFEAFLA